MSELVPLGVGSPPETARGLARLIQVVLPVGGRIMVMVEGYFDESGDFEEDPKVFCLSGYFLSAESAVVMDKEWERILLKHGLPYFHMVDCAHGNGVFSGKDKEERIEIVKSLIELIKKHTIEGFAAITREQDFPKGDGPSPYSHCASACVSALKNFLQSHNITGDVAYFFEAGHPSAGRAYKDIANALAAMSAPLTFAPKDKVRLLQAADLLAWQVTKYMKDKISGKRPPRKDFLSLMDHDHMFAHFLDGGSDGPIMGIELWPMSRRSEYDVAARFDSSGPIKVFFEKGSNIPIVPIGASLGWRMGAMRMAHIAFHGIGEDKVCLAFDEPRLYETIVSLLRAAEMYADSPQVPGISAQDVSFGMFGGKRHLVIKIEGGKPLAFELAPELIEKLRGLLKAD